MLWGHGFPAFSTYRSIPHKAAPIETRGVTYDSVLCDNLSGQRSPMGMFERKGQDHS